MARSVSGFNEEARKSKEDAMKYCKAWQFELTKIGAMLVSELTSKQISQAVYNLKREELNRQTDALNKCIGVLNSSPK
jgi:hypothetical protein